MAGNTGANSTTCCSIAVAVTGRRACIPSGLSSPWPRRHLFVSMRLNGTAKGRGRIARRATCGHGVATHLSHHYANAVGSFEFATRFGLLK